uniref:Uncharacterized protein n=1 Tax=Cyanothece sp. (strain PCC 7425 / ATCC 29141) TaxID=395961 RepID=B8HZ27_CYAP4
MPIHNQPILPNRALGRQKKMLGFFPTYLLPGLLAGLTVMAVASELSKDKLRSAFLGSSVIAAYWLYAGRGEESAWTNFGRFLSVPVFHLPPDPNQETLPPK